MLAEWCQEEAGQGPWPPVEHAFLVIPRAGGRCPPSYSKAGGLERRVRPQPFTAGGKVFVAAEASWGPRSHVHKPEGRFLLGLFALSAVSSFVGPWPLAFPDTSADGRLLPSL